MDTSSCLEPALSGKRSHCLNATNQNYGFKFPYPFHEKDWLRAEATFHCTNKEWNVWKMTQFIVSFFDKGKEIKSKMICVYRFLNDGETKQIYLDTVIPEAEFDEVKIAFWHAEGKQTLLIDDLKISAFK